MSDDPSGRKPRNFLVVVDDTPECRLALRFAARRARSMTDGGVVLLRVTEPPDFQHWMGVGELMREEARQEAEALLSDLAAQVQRDTGLMPQFVIREGKIREEVAQQIAEDDTIRVLVLGAGTDKSGPGPLVSHLSRNSAGLPCPVTIVPGDLSKDRLESIT